MKKYYIGCDVSQKNTALCIIDESGKVISEGGALSRPQDMYGWIKNRVDAAQVERVTLEAGNLSSWLYTGLTKQGLPVAVLEAFHAHKALSMQRNKTDKNDARGLAQLARLGDGWIRLVTVRSIASQEARALLSMRQHLVHSKVDLENHISGIMKPFGLFMERGNISPDRFRDRVIDCLALGEDHGLGLKEKILPMLDLYKSTCHQLATLTRQVEDMANNDPVCKRFMTVPGVGPIIALSFYTAVDNPSRFTNNGDIAAYFGLTPRQYQSGDSNFYGGISKRGDAMTRRHLVQAATVLLTATNRWCPLKAWGMKLATKQGFSKARVAVARKLAILLHRLWMTGEEFRWVRPPKESGTEQAVSTA